MAQPNIISFIIVEDHAVMIQGIMAGLALESDIRVLGTAKTANEGLRLAQQLEPNIILLDLHLPDGDGPKSMVKRFCDLPKSRVIVFSGESRLAFIQTVLELGVAAYLLKSEDANRVAETAREVMAGKTGIISSDLVAKDNKLTPAESDLLHSLAQGLKYADIAERRNTAVGTVRKQTDVLLLKLGIQNREQLIAWAVKNGYGGLDS